MTFFIGDRLMPIPIVCPSCAAKLRAAEGMAGRVTRCPKCGTQVVVPKDFREVPQPARVQPPALQFKTPPVPAPHIENGRGPRNNAEEDERPRGFLGVVVVQQGGHTDAPGVISLIFGCLSVACLLLGCFTCGITYWAAVPFALVGGIVGFFGQGNMRVAGLVLNFLALIPATILLVMFVGMAGVRAAVEPKQPDRKAAQQATAPDQTPPEQPGPKPEPPPSPTKGEPGWASPDQAVVQGDLQVQITETIIGKVPLKDIFREGMSKDDLLMVKLDLINTSPTKRVEYHSWAGKDISFDRDYATLRDNLGNGYKRISFGLGTYPVGAVERSEAIYPNKSLTDVLVFEVPVDTATYLDLELPAKNYGSEGMIRFRIPKYRYDGKAKEEREQSIRQQEEERRRQEEEQRQKQEERDRFERALEKAAEERRKIAEQETNEREAAEAERKAAEAKQRKAAEEEASAERRLAYAKKLLDEGETSQAIGNLREVIERYPDSNAANKARQLLKKIER
jgi:hypothetical protein